MSEKKVHFSEERVQEWSNQNDDKPVGESVFGQRVVPGLMLLDSLSGLVHEYIDGDVILSGITAARFRDPVLIGEVVTFSLGEIEDAKMNVKTVDFKARVEERGSLVATGVLSLTIK